MKIKTQKRLINVMAGAALVATAVWLLLLLRTPVAISLDVPTVDSNSSSRPPSSSDKSDRLVLDIGNKAWKLRLRNPLYDPPPPPKPVVQRRPIAVKLVGTILESENSQAFVRLANGTVELKRVGDLLTDDPRDGTVQDIAANAIVIRRDDGDLQLAVEE